MRHPVNSGDIDKGTLSTVAEPLTDIHAIFAKQYLRQAGLGHVVEAVENHADTTTYCTSFQDSTKFSNAYTEDLLDCLDVAFNQSKRVLNDIDLADTLLLDLKKKWNRSDCSYLNPPQARATITSQDQSLNYLNQS